MTFILSSFSLGFQGPLAPWSLLVSSQLTFLVEMLPALRVCIWLFLLPLESLHWCRTVLEHSDFEAEGAIKVPERREDWILEIRRALVPAELQGCDVNSPAGYWRQKNQSNSTCFWWVARGEYFQGKFWNTSYWSLNYPLFRYLQRTNIPYATDVFSII